MAPAPGGSFCSTVTTLTANLVGAGLLSLPYTLRRAGWVAGVAAMATMGLANAAAFLILCRCADLVRTLSLRDGSTTTADPAASYVAIASYAFGPAASALVTLFLALYTAGSCISFIVLLGDFLPALVCQSGGCGSASPIAWLTSRSTLLILAGGCLLFPLSLFRDLSRLRFTAGLSVGCMLYVGAMLCVKAGVGPRVEWADLTPLNGAAGLFSAFPIMCVALTCHYNAPKFYGELADRSLGRITRIVAAAFACVLTLYLVVAMCGYVLFGADTQGDVLNNFGEGDPAAVVARVALTAILCCCYPLVFVSLRGAVTQLLPRSVRDAVGPGGGGAARGATGNKGAGEGEGDDGTDPLLGRGEGKPARAASWGSDWPHALLTVLLVGVTVGIAEVLPNIATVLAYKGAVGASVLVYVLPFAMHFVLARRVSVGVWAWGDLASTWEGGAALAAGVGGLVLMGLGVATTAGWIQVAT